jgi:2-oxoadipate dioxygenase/decarboxylase
MSRMYQAEVPQYGVLMDIVASVNAATLRAQPALDRRIVENGEFTRLNVERHGAIRVGTAQEMAFMRRLFAVMGMQPVGYYDLSVAGVPVHSTAFRPVDAEALKQNPFRVFASLLRLELIQDQGVRREAAAILAKRSIFTPGCLTLIARAEEQGGLDAAHAQQFVSEALETFRWHRQTTVSADTYRRLRAAHPLIADVTCFHGPHINHLTPRTLDIDAAQVEMIIRGLSAKAVIEGPPRRDVPILLRQTSFKALNEPVAFRGADGSLEEGAHTARFGEIEQRGVALTPKGRALYDRLLAETQQQAPSTSGYAQVLGGLFKTFPDNETDLRREGLAYFRYRITGAQTRVGDDIEAGIAGGAVSAEPITYEDFLPISAAGIFRSNLGNTTQMDIAEKANQAAFEQALGVPVLDPFDLYSKAESDSLQAVRAALGPREFSVGGG